jgi:hypothetical protein
LSLFDEVAARIGQTAAGLAISAARRSLPAGMGPLVNTGINTAGKVLSGDFGGAAAGVLDSGVLVQHFPFLTGLASNALFMVTPTPLFGGISPMEARRIYDQCQAEAYARKNLFLVEVSGRDGNDGAGEFKFNLFATDVSYSPYTLSGDKQKIGRPGRHAETVVRLPRSHGDARRWLCRAPRGIPAEDPHPALVHHPGNRARRLWGQARGCRLLPPCEPGAEPLTAGGCLGGIADDLYPVRYLCAGDLMSKILSPKLREVAAWL